MKCCNIVAVLGLLLGCGAKDPSRGARADLLQTEWDICKQNEKLESLGDVEICYSRLCDPPHSFHRACLSEIKWLLKNHQSDKARLLAREFIEQYPDSAHAQSAVKKLATSFLIANQVEEGIVVFRGVEQKVAGREVHDTVLWALAGLHRELDQQLEEEQTLRVIIEKFDRWTSQLYDDALWRLGQIMQNAGRQNDEKVLLEQFVGTRESSWIIGSYNSPYLDDALLRLGEIALERKQWGPAAKYFLELSELESSRLRDEALVGSARVRFANGQIEKGCALLNQVQTIPAASARKEALALARSKECFPR